MTLPEKPDSVIDWKYHEKVQPLHAPGCPASICTCGAALAMTHPSPGVGPALSALIEQIEDFCGWWHMNREGSVNRTYDHIDKTVKQLEAALSGSVGGLNAAPPWQDIATAPRDGTRIVGWCPRPAGGVEPRVIEAITVGGARPRIRWASVPGNWDSWPTRWMPILPLPASPVCAAEKKNEKG